MTLTIAAKTATKNVFQIKCFDTNNFAKVTKQSLYKANSFACSLENRDKPVAATLQRNCSGGIIFVMITKILKNCSKEFFCNSQKNPRAHKNKIGSPPPPKKKTPKHPPPPKRGILWAWVFSCRKNAFFQAPIKLAQPLPAPEYWAKFFTDTRIFLKLFSEKAGPVGL